MTKSNIPSQMGAALLSNNDLELLKKHLSAENAHDMAGTLATLTPNCEFEDMALGQTFKGHKGAEDYYRMWWEGFAMTVHTEERHYVSPSQVIVETRFKGRHCGDAFGIAATGREIDIPFCIYIELRDGLLHKERFYWDRSTLLRQLASTEGL